MRDLPSPHFEYMLTDACGNGSQGFLNGPRMNLREIYYNASQSKYTGQAVTFQGTTTSYARSDANSLINSPMLSESITVMYWLYWNNPADISTILEFSASNIRGIHFWLLGGGLWYNFSPSFTNGCSGSSCQGIAIPFVPSARTWYHFAHVYNGTGQQFSTFVNGTFSNSKSIYVDNSVLKW